MMRPTFDDRDQVILDERIAELDAIEEPRVGDWVHFPDDQMRRISYIWPDDGVQTSKGGSYYLGNGYVSMSGSLFTSVPRSSLTLTTERRDGWVWFFHHDLAGADLGVDVSIPFRVYECSVAAPLV